MQAFLVLLMLSVLWAGPNAVASPAVSIGVHNYPPFFDERGRGLLSDVLTAAYGAVGVETRITSVPIPRSRVQFMNLEIDAMIGGNYFFNQPEQAQIASSPVLNVLPSWFFYMPHFDQPDNIQSLEDLVGYRVGVIVNSPYLDLYARHGMNVFEIQTPEQLLLMTKKGRIDFFEATLLTGLHLIQQLMPADKEQFDYIRWDVLEVALSFHKTNTRTRGLQQQFEIGLEKIRVNGELLKILESYWGVKNVPQAVFIHQYPFLGVPYPDTSRYWSYSRSKSGRILQADEGAE